MTTRARHRIPRWLLAAVVVTVVAGGVASACAEAGAAPRVVIGAGATAEQQVLAAIAHESVRRAGVPVDVREGLGGTTGLRRQALADQVDLYWDYTGAAWTLGLRETAPPADPLESWERVREADADQGLRWLEASGANATFALVVRRSDLPPAGGQRGMGWLAGELSSGTRRLCADPDFLARADGLPSLAAEYGIDTAGMPRRAASEDEAIRAVRAGECFAGLATATSGAARAAGLVPVEDELRVFPAFVVAPVVREGSPADRPPVAEALRRVTTALDTSTLARLNAQVVDGEDPVDVAGGFLDGLERPDTTPAP
jgi:osmoprotectant transport system substrate-binding protein